jgi:hypothetical protein
MDIDNDFLKKIQITQEIRARTYKWKSTSITELPKSRDNLQNGKKIFASYSPDKGLISTIYKELNKLGTKRTNNTTN